MDVMAATEILARSTTMTSVGWIAYIIIGGIAGWIAGKIVRGRGQGILMNIVIGIVGALIGGFLLSFFVDTAGGGWWFTLFTAILGSVILLWIVGLVRRA
ncbi:MAG: GlsB/YeaQ/YmgE family stress response membrane protein [Mycobacterium sp.]